MTVSTNGLAVLGGMITVLSPCVLPMTYLGIADQSHQYGPLASGWAYYWFCHTAVYWE